MVQKKKQRPRKTKPKSKPFSFQLGWGGLAGIGVVGFCLFLWMFLLGIWAGQTILLPATGVKLTRSVKKTERPDSKTAQFTTITPLGKKKPVAMEKQ